MDIFLDSRHVCFILQCIWRALQIAEEHKATLTWACAVPYKLARILTNIFRLTSDGFSDAYNNSYHDYIIDPASSFSFLSTQVNVFTVLMEKKDLLSALCNPPFAAKLISQFLNTVTQRCQNDLLTNLIYIGPDHPGLHKLYGSGYAKCLAVFRRNALPFIHALTGTMRGFPKKIHMWWLGNVQLPSTRSIVKALKYLHKCFPLDISHHIYEVAPCRLARHWQRQDQWQQLIDAQVPYKALLQQKGRLSWKALLPLYLRVYAAAKKRPLCDKLTRQFPHIAWNFDVQQTGCSCVYVIICTACSYIYVGSTVQAPWQRVQQELSGARRIRHFCTPRNWRHRLHLSEHMNLHGLGNSVWFIVEAWNGTNESYIRHREWLTMLQFPRQKLLNSKVPHSGRVTISPKTLTICRQGVKSLLTDAQFAPLHRDIEVLGIKELINKIITSNRVPYDARTLLLLHQHLMNFSHPMRVPSSIFVIAC